MQRTRREPSEGRLVPANMNLEKFVGCEWLFNAKTKRAVRSTLATNANCRFDHASCWENIERLNVGPSECTLRDLLSPTESRNATLQFCQQVAVRGRCGSCFAECERVHWTANLHRPMYACPYCGKEDESGQVFPIPYWSFSRLSASQLQPVWHISLAEWGVEPQAVIGIRCSNTVRTVIVGEERQDTAETDKQGVL